MKQHQYEVGDRVLWQCAFGTPLSGVVEELVGHGETGDPEYRVVIERYDWSLLLGESVLRASGTPATELAPLIGLAGRKRVGKDTAAAELVEHYGFVRLGFADVLKDLALDLNPQVGIKGFLADGPEPTYLAPLVAHIGWERAKARNSVRVFLQRLGDRGRVRLGDRIWIDRVLEKAAELRAAGIPVVISDVRYLIETDAIKAAGGEVVKIVRPSLESSDSHPSEAESDAIEADFLITNEGSLEDFVGEVHYVADALNLYDFTPAALAV